MLIKNEIIELVDSYFEWFKKGTKISQLKSNEYSLIHTPFLDFNNDSISVYAKVVLDSVFLTDDGQTFRNLEMYGLSITPKRTEQINNILSRNNIELSQEQELFKKIPKNDFAEGIHTMITAMIDVSNLYMTSQEKVASFFREDVITYLDRNEIYYTEDVEFKGKSNFSHTYDLLFQKNAINPERLCSIIDNPNKAKIANILFSWEDTRDARNQKNKDPKLVVILNDQTSTPNSSIIGALERYDIRPILWKSIEDKVDFLR